MTLLAVLAAAFVIVTVTNMRHISHRIDQVIRPPLDERDVDLWVAQVMAADTDTIIREAQR